MVNGILWKLVVIKESETLPLPKAEGDDRVHAHAHATLLFPSSLDCKEMDEMFWTKRSYLINDVEHQWTKFQLKANHAKGFSRTDLVTQFNALKDESAGFIVSIMDPQPGEDIIECCAAPGGKTLYMASHLHGQGMVF